MSPTDKKVQKCQNCHPGHEFKERVQEYLDMKRKFKKISYSKDVEKVVTFEQQQDMKNRPKIKVSPFGQELAR